MNIAEYLGNISDLYKSGKATEPSYYGDLNNLLVSICPECQTISNPKQIQCGAPDHIVQRKDIKVGVVEDKEIGANLNEIEKSEQLERYRKAEPNLILTDFIKFRFYRNGKRVGDDINIAKVDGNKIIPIESAWKQLEDYIKDFCSYKGQTIKSAEQLAKMMADKARLMQDVIYKAVTIDKGNSNSTLSEQLKAFREILIHDIDEKQFADIYAQTIAYGLFAARLHDTTIDTFSRQEASYLIPKTNPFLRKLFNYIAGPDLDERIVWIVDDLAKVFLASDMKEILKDFGSTTQQNDPMIHFYETFLAEYDPALRESRGVYYTPEPVVNYIVRAVDDVLKSEFGLSDGLADTSTIDAKVSNQRKRYLKLKIPRVQILDPAAGTGTFLYEVIKLIHKRFKGQQGIWSKYVETQLIPRIYGFEILMASYAICHLKLEMILSETGFKPHKDQRLNIFLTNSLEESHPDTGTLWATWLSAEANEANHIKKDVPVMVVIGNPPYSGISMNQSVGWITKKIDDYKYVNGKYFDEKKHWLNDDYVKFIRLAESYIEKNGEGVIGFITNHGYVDNPTFRGMRWHLLNTFDRIYVLDLHGNSKKNEVAPDGSPDKNVFDIQQGVAILIAIKTGKKKKGTLAKLLHNDLYGSREEKYSYLWKNIISNKAYKELNPVDPYYFFAPKDFEGEEKYNKGFKINDLFPVNVTGIVTARDALVIDVSEKELLERIKDFADPSNTDEQVRAKYFGNKKPGKYASGDSRGWKLPNARKCIANVDHKKYITHITYRPFDDRYVYYHEKMVDWGRWKIFRHFLKDNVGLNWIRPMSDKYDFSISISKYIADQCSAGNKSAGAGISYLAPLYLYPEEGQEGLLEKQKRSPNIDKQIISAISGKINLEFVPEKSTKRNKYSPIDIMDYVYAVLYSPNYRNKYGELLKVDFPRIPYPKNVKQFWSFVDKGSELRELHLMESSKLKKLVTSYPIDGNNSVENVKYDGDHTGKVWINETQYFDKVPKTAWEFIVGGYQPVQKWLKDRKGRKLSYEDIIHYQKIIIALIETDRIMKEIDKIDFLGK